MQDLPEKNDERRNEDAKVRNSTIILVVILVVIMKKENILIPKPKSKFLSVQCPECQEKMIIFSHTTIDIPCKSCGKLIAVKRGGKARILGKLLAALD